MMLKRRQLKVGLIVIAATLVAAVPSAFAHEGHDHSAEGGGGEAPPAGAVTPPANPANPNAPAPGAQPAAPDAAPADPAPVDAGAEAAPVDVDDVIAALADTTKPAVIKKQPSTSSSPVVSGSGTSGAPASGGGSGPVAAPSSPVVAGSGELPFTGVEENILIISLAGMLAPMGVLLYCAARRGDVKLALAMPRFHWATREPRIDPVETARTAREQAARCGAAFEWTDR